ncbi:hypothetical protein [uncultured Clostridium sp.]|uniref:hypothetical protein n=1 Tax=uncultured Clostridium sp. TaxID=59620 RepID=UPI0027DE7B2E|nr:hypothetical protein [uncultured Clostridium sp.]
MNVKFKEIIKKKPKKQVTSIPLNTITDGIIIRNKYEFSKVYKINLEDIKEILLITDPLIRYKLFLDIDFDRTIKSYLVEKVIANNLNEAREKFKYSAEPLDITEYAALLSKYYNNEIVDYFVDEKELKKVIAPYKMECKQNYFITDVYKGYVNIAERLSYDFLNISNIIYQLKGNMLISIDFKRVDIEYVLNKIDKENFYFNIIQERVNDKEGTILFNISIISLFNKDITDENFNEFIKYNTEICKRNGIKLNKCLDYQRNAFNKSLLYGLDENKDIIFDLSINDFLDLFKNINN